MDSVVSRLSIYLLTNEAFMDAIAAKLFLLVLTNEDFKQAIFDSLSLEYDQRLMK